MKVSSALALLVLRVFADDHHFALALDDFAFFTHGLDRRSDFHWISPFTDCHTSTGRTSAHRLTVTGKVFVTPDGTKVLFASPGNAAAGQIIGTHLNRNLVTGKNADEIHTQLT